VRGVAERLELDRLFIVLCECMSWVRFLINHYIKCAMLLKIKFGFQKLRVGFPTPKSFVRALTIFVNRK
jgi:hypothetical protein